jgi:hypothetical protein
LNNSFGFDGLAAGSLPIDQTYFLSFHSAVFFKTQGACKRAVVRGLP